MKNSIRKILLGCAALLAALAIIAILCACASSGATSAEEYYNIGMAYFEMGQNAKNDATREKNFLEAEKWLNRARSIDKTKSASEYNLGRIAFETGRYEEAARHFEGILKRDKTNVTALQAACYTRIKMGDIEKAEAHYAVLLNLAPESADDGYNYALVLFSMGKYEMAQAVLDKYQFALLDNNDTILLYARILNAQEKIESLNFYTRWFAANKDSKDSRVRLEFAKVLESQEFYARALEECRTALEDLQAGSTRPTRGELRFVIGRILLESDPSSNEGVKELEGAVDDGYNNIDALEFLANGSVSPNWRISTANRDAIRAIVGKLQRAQSEAAANTSEQNVESGSNSSNE